MSEKLRAWLQQETNRRGWSYRELARQAGVSQSNMSRVVTGDMPPSADFCIRIATAFDEPPVKLLKLAGILPDEPALTESEFGPVSREILQLVQNLPLEQRQQVLDYVRFLSQQRKD